MQSTQQPDAQKFRIGAVSRLTNIPADTIRVWERRYGAVQPERMTGGSRLYSQQDIARLKMLRELVDRGQAIGSIANLADEALAERLQLTRAPGLPSRHTPLKLVVVGSKLGVQIEKEWGVFAKDEIVAIYPSLAALDQQLSDAPVTTLAVEYPTLQSESLPEITAALSRLNATHCVVVYQFASRERLELFHQSGIETLKAPIELAELRRVCLEWQNLDRSPEASLETFDPSTSTNANPPRLFTREQLAQLTMVTSAVRCECPNHLADIILNLEAFETYSLECQNRNADDARLHAFLHRATAKARAMMEDALRQVAAAEHIEVN